MLITTCSHCQARFRVTPQQLNARQGQVRCGRCSQVFNGFQMLERFPDDDTGGRLLAEHERRAIAGQSGGPAAAATPSSTPPPSGPADSAGAVDLPLDDEQPAAPRETQPLPEPVHGNAPEAIFDPAPEPDPPAPEPAPGPARSPRRWLRHQPDLTLYVDPPNA